MPKFSFMSWNVRHFKGTPSRLNDVESLVRDFNPDVVGFIEYQGKRAIRELIVERFPDYDFAVTDSTQNLEVVVAFRRNKFDQVVWTQKREFNNARRSLRPGALISLRLGQEFYNLLYLHSDSGVDDEDYRNRQDILKKVWKLRKALEKRNPSGLANFIVLGDLNTMGKKPTISGNAELNRLVRDAGKAGMSLLEKDRMTTWSQWRKGRGSNRRKLRVSELNDLYESNLDHVIAESHLDFVAHGDAGEPVHVEGWHQTSGTAKTRFLWDISDHCALFAEVW